MNRLLVVCAVLFLFGCNPEIRQREKDLVYHSGPYVRSVLIKASGDLFESYNLIHGDYYHDFEFSHDDGPKYTGKCVCEFEHRISHKKGKLIIELDGYNDGERMRSRVTKVYATGAIEWMNKKSEVCR